MKSATLSLSVARKLLDISIHALHEECDLMSLSVSKEITDFNPRTP